MVNEAHRTKRGWKVEMCAFSTAYNGAGELAQGVDKLRPLDREFESFGHFDFEWTACSLSLLS